MKTYETLGKSVDGDLAVFNKHLMRQFLVDNLGKRIKLTIEVLSDDRPSVQRYYYGCIEPQLERELRRHGNIMPRSEVRDFLQTKSPVSYDTSGKLRPLEEFDSEDWFHYVNDLIRWAAEELNCIINEPGRYE